jgi:hypothetical protein
MVILEPLEMPPPVDVESVAEKPDSPDDPSTEPDPRIVRGE